MALWFRRSIWLAWMRCSFRETSEKLFLCVFCACTEHFPEQICMCLSFTHAWQNPELLRGYQYFRNALLTLMIFQNKYGRAVTVGMYVGLSPPTINQSWKDCGQQVMGHSILIYTHSSNAQQLLAAMTAAILLREHDPYSFLFVFWLIPLSMSDDWLELWTSFPQV